jgi:hypothetical protein
MKCSERKLNLILILLNMKSKIIFFVMLLVLAGTFAMQSCKKEAPVGTTPYLAAMPGTPVPANYAAIPFTASGQAVNLSWAGTATNAISWNVYFGTSSTPPKVASNVATNAYTAHIGTIGGKYYWGVSTVDANGLESDSPTWSFIVHSAPTAPATPSPALNATGVSCTTTLTWTATDPEGFALTYDLLFGTTATPAIKVYSGLTSASDTVPAALSPFTVYYWQVIAHDGYGGNTTGPIWSFTTGALPINTFVGNYSVAEPAEGWSYPISFTFNSTTSIKTTGYWASTGWNAVFNINLTNLTYSMPLTTFPSGYSGIESGVINKTTGKMTGEYTIWSGTVVAEQGLHTYTHL